MVRKVSFPLYPNKRVTNCHINLSNSKLGNLNPINFGVDHQTIALLRKKFAIIVHVYLSVNSVQCMVPFIVCMENRVDLDQLASGKPADLDLHCLNKGYIMGKKRGLCLQFELSG